MWTHFKPTEKQGKKERYLNFDEFKSKSGISKLSNIKAVTAEEESKRLEFASQFIKTREEITKDGTV